MKYKTKKLAILVLLVIFLAPTVFSIFHNTITKEIDISSTERKITEGKVSNPHILVKFDTANTKKYKEELERRGFEFVNYRGENSWIMTFPKSEINFIKAYDNAIIIRDIKSEEKIFNSLKIENQPSWVDNGDGTWNLLIKCYEDIDISLCKDRLMSYGHVKEQIGISSFIVAVKKDNIRLVAEDDYVLAMSRKPSPIKPHLDQSKITIGANLLQAVPYNLDGDGIIVAMFEASDKGATRPDDSHSDLSGRILYGDNTGSSSEHATQVAGVLGGRGNLNSSLKGVAPEVRIISYSAVFYPNTSKLQNAISLAATIAQNSFGRIVNESTCEGHGNYEIFEAELDDTVKGSLGKPLTIIFSAGNERELPYSCPMQAPGYNSTTQHSTAKNVISVGAINSDDGKITSFSSFGPTDDGRIKPDLVAPGCQSNNDLGITTTNVSNKYGTICGTSLAAPHVSGTIALMLEHLKKLYSNKVILPSTIKALLIDSANDVNNSLTTTIGPDYASGYGVINSTAAINRITFNNFEEGTLYDNQTVQTYILVPPNETKLKVTLVWDDKGQPGSVTKKLINDLDLTLIAPNGSLYYPWTLDANNPSNAAIRTKRDDINNVEQVVVDNPISGQWIIKVNESDLQYDQNYSLVSSFLNTNLPTIGTTTKTIGHAQEWRGFISIANYSNKKLDALLTWEPTGNQLNLSLIAPDGSIHKNFVSDEWTQKVSVERPINGIWMIKVVGNNVLKSNFVNFTITTSAVTLSGSTPPDASKGEAGGINFTFSRLNYISACNNTGEGLTVVLKGEKANSSQPIVDISNKTNLTSKVFLTGLVLPNHKMVVSMYPMGSVSIDQFLARTEAGKVMLDADVKLKFSFYNTQASKNEYLELNNYWHSLLNQGTYANELRNAGYLGGFSWEARQWISPNSLKAEGEGCKVFLTNATLNVDSELRWAHSGIDSYNVKQEVKDYVKELFTNNLTGNLTSWLNRSAQRAQTAINTEDQYADLRYIYASLAMAQWYKTLDRSQVLFGNLIDGNNIGDYNLNISFDEDYWKQQSKQRITENLYFNCFTGGSCYTWMYGGVVYINLSTNIISVLTNETQQLITDAVDTIYAQKSNENNSFYYANFIEVKKADLDPIAIGFSELEPHTGKNVNISVAIENKGDVNANNFNVNFYYNYTNVNGTSAIYPIGIVGNQNVTDGNIIVVKKEWISGQLGKYDVFIEVDYNNNVSERNELNNLIKKSIERITPYPNVTITSPANNVQAIYRQSITFTGVATDLQDGTLSGSSFNWSSNIDGYLGSGTTLTANLSAGAQIVTLTVTDREGYQAKDTISLGILPSNPPSASITSPVSRSFAEGETIYFEGSGEDIEDGTNLAYSWNSSSEGLLSISKSFSVKNLSVGTHAMSFGVTDSTSLTTYFVFNLTINEGTPSVTILNPKNNQYISYKAITNFSANATDPQDGNISSAIAWTSSINGKIGNGGSFNYNLSIGTHDITATVLDSHGNTAVHQIKVTVKEPQYPTASIISPRNNQVFVHGENITFKSIYSDFEDQIIDNLSLIWNSSIINVFGNGTDFIKPNISIGNHTIYFIVRDSDNMSSTASVNITVNPAPPVPSISNPKHGKIFAQIDYIVFNGTANDYEDGILTGNSLNWTSSKNGFLGSGTFLNLTNLTAGTHLITFTANDIGGLKVTTSINIIVVGLNQVLVNKFMDGLTTKNVTFNTTQNVSQYVKIPKSANVTYAAINIRGYSP